MVIITDPTAQEVAAAAPLEVRDTNPADDGISLPTTEFKKWMDELLSDEPVNKHRTKNRAPLFDARVARPAPKSEVEKTPKARGARDTE